MDLPSSPLFTSSLVVRHNAVKNILFRAATIILDFVILRIFAFIAFRCRDYTSFLIFAEDIVQKALFVFSRGFRRQAFLVLSFIIFVGAAGFYDTLLWGLDNPGYVLRRKVVNGESLASRMADHPDYINYITANISNPDAQNNLNTTFNANLFVPGLNFTLPGVITGLVAEVVPPLNPLGPDNNATARIWLDDSGFAVGLDPTFMSAGITPSENTTGAYQRCYPSNAVGEKVFQSWSCAVPDAVGATQFANMHGRVLIQWVEGHINLLEPRQTDNPWKSLGQGAGTAMMKQVISVTKGHRRHTFLSTVYKGTMLSYRPNRLDDMEITDFMRRTWFGINGTLTSSADARSLKTLTNTILYAKGNDTGVTFGAFAQLNTSLSSASTEYINVLGINNQTLYSALRYVYTNITLIRSEIRYATPTPLEPCPGVAYVNSATGGVVRSTNCHSATPNNDSSTQFLGQVDTSAVAIINSDLMGDGTSNLSSVAVSPHGVSWVLNNEDEINRLLLSRALLLGGSRDDVTVYVQYTVPAVSIVQVILCAIPIVLLLLAYFLTRRPVMSYFKSSFLAAVLATTHVSTSSCEKLGYIYTMPDISLHRHDQHVTLRTPGGATFASIVPEPQGLVYEPLMQGKDETCEMLALQHNHRY